jgi:lipoprotein-anchoring transpeptidase ErfK/SrfK
MSENTPAGGFVWLNDEVLQWKPDGFWPAHSPVTVVAGGAPTQFETGAAVVGVANISAHTFTVSIDGQVARQMPASMGKPSRPTPVGSFSVLEKDRSVVMDSRTIGIPLSSPEGYRITAQYAERINWGGVFVHSAPWSVDSQGHENVSHGCINLSPDNAAWYYNTVSVGDPVIVNP